METFKVCKICGGTLHLENEKFALSKCMNCLLVFCYKIYSNIQFKKVYNDLYNKNENPKYYKHSRIEYENLKKGIVKIGFNRKRILSKYVLSKNIVLEIGSGIGLIGYYLTYKRKVKKYFGIEIDKKSHKKALEFNLNSLNGDFTLVDKISNNFDIVMLWEVLEHIQDLDTFFKLVNSKLKHKGKIIISVPNYNKRLNNNNRNCALYQSGPPVHLNFFTKESLFRIFAKYGFDVVYFREKKLPYFNISWLYFSNVIKSFIGTYNGSTLYLVAKKK